MSRPTLATRTLVHVRRLVAGPIARASGTSLAVRLGGLVLTFVLAVLTARMLGPAGYGTVAWVISMAQVFAIAATFGLGGLSVREVPARLAVMDRAGLSAYLQTGLRVTLALSLLASVAVGVILWNATRPVLAIGGLLVTPLAMLALLRGWAQGFARIAIAQIPGEVVRPGVMVLILLTAWASGYRPDVASYLAAVVAALLLAVVFGVMQLRRTELLRLPAAGPRSAGSLKGALPFLCLGLAAVVQGEINTLLLGRLAGPVETGLFQPIARFAPLLMLPVEAASMRYAPRVAELWKIGERRKVRQITATFAWTTALLTLLASLALSLAGPWLLLIFGREFAAMAPLLWIVAAAQSINAACGPGGLLLTMTGHTGSALMGQMAGLTVNVVLALVLVPLYGALGATAALAGGIVALNVAMAVLAARAVGFDPTIGGSFRRGAGN